MSEVISFRLNKTNSREAQALEVLELWCAKGYSVRYILTEALLKMNGAPSEPMDNPAIQELSIVIRQTNELLEQIGNIATTHKSRETDASIPPLLSSSFVTAIKRSVKPGLEVSKDTTEPYEVTGP